MRILITTPNDAYATSRFIEEAPGLGMEVICRDVKDLAVDGWNIDANQFDALWIRQVFPYYKELINLAKQFSDAGKRVIDSNIPKQGIEDNKWKLLQKLQSIGLCVPYTELCSSPIYGPINRQTTTYPIVAKWIYGFGARHVHLLENDQQFQSVIKKYPAGELMLQEYIEAEFEYSVVTVGYKSLPVVVRYKIHPTKKVSDLEHFDVLDASIVPEVVRMAERGAEVLGRELAKSDVLEKNGKFYLLEVNRMPGLTAFEQATNLNVAKVFLDYIVNYISVSSQT